MSQSRTETRKLLTLGNAIAAIVLLVGLPLIYIRWTQGLGAIGDASHDAPWGFWIGFNVMAGVALSAGGYVTASAVHLFGMKDYEPVVRPAILTGFLGYVLVIIGVGFDLGRPWHMPYLMIQPGLASVLFLVGLHVGLYSATQLVEISPALFEWLNWRRWRKVAVGVTVGATIFGVILSTLHQSALGALFLITPTKVHPLWYSELIPLFFFVSSIAAGLAVVTFVGFLCQRFFADKVEMSDEQLDRITLGLGKASSITLAVYFSLQVIGIAHDHKWHYLGTPLGYWFLVELLGFVLLPCVLFVIAARERRPGLARGAAVITILGIVLNRLNLSIIAFNWQHPGGQHVPHWKELWISLTIVTVGVLVFRWIVNRMPIVNKHPDYEGSH
jgi:Ni/Fe-hydrogenase subunit HybB-like protein